MVEISNVNLLSDPLQTYCIFRIGARADGQFSFSVVSSY